MYTDDSQRLGRDTIDISQTNASTFPTITKPNVVLRLNASQNTISLLPNMSIFSRLRYLDLSHNKFQDLSPLSSLVSLLELDISYNFVNNVDFLRSLNSLEILHASKNKISQIDILPETLIEIDLSKNMINSLDFLDRPNDPFPVGIERLNVSDNDISEIINLKYITLFQQLKELDIGILNVDSNRNLQLLPFVKCLCPSLQYFDGADLSNVDEFAFNINDLVQVIAHGSESEIRSFISEIEPGIRWEQPKFIDFDDDTPPTPLKSFEDRLRLLEDKVSEETEFTTPVKGQNPNQTGTLLSPYGSQDDNATIAQMQHEISDLKQQVAQIAEILYIHDRALRQLWEGQ